LNSKKFLLEKLRTVGRFTLSLVACVWKFLKSIALNIAAIIWFLITLPILLRVVDDAWFASGLVETQELRWSILGLVGLLGIPFVAWRTWISERDAKTSEGRLINERFAKA